MVFGNLLFRRLQRPVGGIIGQIQEERLVIGALHRRIQISQSMIGEGIGGIEAIVWRRIRFVIDRHMRPRAGFGIPAVIIHRPIDLDKRMVKTTMHRPFLRPAPQVPFTHHQGLIAGRPQAFGDGWCIGGQVILISLTIGGGPGGCRVIIDHITNPHLMGVTAGQQSRTRGATARLIVELREGHPGLGQAINIGSGDFRAITPQIRIAQIIGQDQDNIRAQCWRRGRRVTGGDSQPGQQPQKQPKK